MRLIAALLLTATFVPAEQVRIKDPQRDMEAVIDVSFGNNASSFTVHGKNLFWTPEGWPKRTLAGNPLLAPWANRLDQDAFYANGKKYTLNPGLNNFGRDENGHPIHGLLAFSPYWEVVSRKDNEVTSRLEFWRYPDLMAQFPFAHTMEMTYRLTGGALEIRTRVENLGKEPMPLAIGYHPYFKVDDAPRDEWRVHVAAREHVTISPQLIPTGEVTPVRLTDPVSLKTTLLDDIFTNLIRDDRGLAEFWVQGKQQKVSVIYGPKYGVAIVFAPRGRDFICFEPMTAVTNAFNLAHAGVYKDLPSIPPGGVWEESYWVKPSGY